jgi:hypothetical protein
MNTCKNALACSAARPLAAFAVLAFVGAVAFSSPGCDNTQSKTKTTTKKTEQTPEGTKTTTETHEKTTDIDKNK